MRKLLRAISSTVLWSHDRGSWPYDLMVAAIVIFVLVTPRRWFHDQPENATSNTAGIVVEEEDPVSHTEILRIAASLLGQPPRGKSTPQLEQKMHQILSGSVDDLKSRRFQIQSIDLVRASNGALLYYEVQVKR